MKEKRRFELLLIAIFVLSVGILVGVVLYSDDVKHLENEVVEEQLQNITSTEIYIEQIVDDFELVIELQQYYYQNNITSYSFGDWLQINYPELYKRLESYF